MSASLWNRTSISDGIGFFMAEGVVMVLTFKGVVVQRMFDSPRVTKWFRRAQQRKPIGEIDLRGCTSLQDFMVLWHEAIRKNGQFSLLAKNQKGQFAKCVGIVNVSGKLIDFKDKRCSLAIAMKKNAKKKEGAKQFDYVMQGGRS